MAQRGTWWGRIALLGAAVLLAGVPLVANGYQLDLLSTALIYGLFAMSLDLIWGYTGILNLGHGVFFGLGAYASAMVMKGFDLFNPTLPAFLAAIALPMALAFLLGCAAFFSGTVEVYFAIITLAVSLMFEKVVIVSYDFTGGSNGIINIPYYSLGPSLEEGLILDQPALFFYFVLGVVLLCFLLARKIVTSPFGRVLEAIRENSVRTGVLGYNVVKYKLIIFVISGGIAGLAGALFAPVSGIVYPALFGIILSASVLIWVAVGGRGTLVGAFIGALVIKLGEAYLSDVLVTAYLIIIGALFVVVVVLLPSGLAGIFLRNGSRNAPSSRGGARRARERLGIVES